MKWQAALLLRNLWSDGWSKRAFVQNIKAVAKSPDMKLIT
jgi:hypothetical protein